VKTGLGELQQRAIYDEYKRRLDARAVLEHYGAENCSELSGSDGTTEVVHSCLIDRVEPHHTNGDASPSACANLEKKLYTCYAGGWSGDFFHLIAKMEGKESLADALPVIGEFLTGAVSEAEDLRTTIGRFFTRPGADLIDLPTYHERVLKPWALVHPYLYEERGITVEAASKLQLGFDERENRIVFPHFWNGRLIGWQKRAIPSRPGWPGTYSDYPKYRSSLGMPKSETLYHYDQARKYTSVLVVESPMSVAKAVSWGLDNICATFGAKVSDRQIDLLKGFNRVTVWFDSEPAGRAGERKLVQGLYRHTAVDAIIPEEDTDLADYTHLDEAVAMWSRAVPAALRLPEYGGGITDGRAQH